jgi:ribosomal protein S14
VSDFLVRKGDSNAIERALKKRDRERCARCGFDARFLQQLFSRLHSEYAVPIRERLGLSRFSFRSRLWDGDHTVPVAEGGGGCGLDGYRTLCIWCHRESTALLARRLADSRRGQMAMFGRSDL